MGKELNPSGGAAILSADAALHTGTAARKPSLVDNARLASYTTTADELGSKAGVGKVQKKADAASPTTVDEAQCAAKQSLVYQEIAARESVETGRAVKMLDQLKRKK